MKAPSRLAVVATLLTLLLSLAAPSRAQSDRGTLTGTVKDQSGGLVPNAKVTATNTETNESREATTTGEGNYTIPELKAGPYHLTVEAQGFKTATADLQIAVQVTRTFDATLEVGAVGESVTVTSDSTPVIQTETSVRQTNVTERQVKELPLEVTSEFSGRTPLSFIFLDSTVTSGTGTGTNASNFRVGGGQGLGTEIQIDGATTRRSQNGSFFSEVAPGPNAYQEFTISTSSYSAEFGQSSGGVVNFTLKSGTNEFHGEVYDLFHNNALNANSFVNNSEGLAINRDHEHDYGGNVGGPIYLPRFGEGGKSYWSGKNRAFFFFNMESYRFAQGESVFLSVPTLRMRTGDFSELLTDPTVIAQNGGRPIQLYSPIAGFDASGRVIVAPPGTRVAIPGNRIDLFRLPSGQSIIDPVGQNILSNFPTPTRAGVFRNYLASTSTPTTMNNPTFKIDTILSQKQHLNFSFSHRNNQRIAGGSPRFPDPVVALGRWQQFFKSDFYRVQHDYTFGPRVLNHFNLGFNRFDVANHNTTEGFNTASLGLPVNATQNKAFPNIDFPGYGDPADPNGNIRSYQGIGSTFFSDHQRDNSWDISDFVSYVHGRQTMRFGADFRYQQFNVLQLLSPGGQFNFRSPQTSNCNCDAEGWPIASLITGATEFSFNAAQNFDPSWRQFTHSYFLQDDIKVTQRLTVNAGLRYDLPGLRTEGHGAFRGFDPTVPNPSAGGRLGAIVTADAQRNGGIQAQYETLTKPDRSNIGPRLGFAYSLDNKTVVRGGAGLYYAPILYGVNGANTLTEGTEGFNTPYVPNCDTGPGCTANERSDLFLRNFRSVSPTSPTSQLLGNTVNYFDRDFRTGRTFQYGLDVQHELPWKFVATLSYTGHRASRLRSNFNRINAIPFNALRLGAPLLNKNLNDVTPAERAYAQSVGVTIPASSGAVFPGFNGSVGQSLKPYPQYAFITDQLESQGRSWYDAGTAKLERRYSNGIQFGASYTFSKLLTNAAEDLFGGSPTGSVIQIPGDAAGLKSVSPNNATHVFVVNYLVELPFGKGRRFLNEGGWSDRIFGGWQINGIQRYQSGLPLVIRLSQQGIFSGGSSTGFNTDIRPNLTGQPILTGNSLSGSRVQVFNPAAFSTPPCYDCGAVPAEFTAGGAINPAYTAYYANPLRFFGNAPATIPNARVLPFLSENISLLKKTRLSETVVLELGAEAFNVFNRHRFNFPGSDLIDPFNFGFSSVAGSDVYAPRVVQIRVRVTY
ncbi:MAG: TonB-dependent receptor [Acidobacteria bacterium]|nr:TonB-dependent receptor [Acidobacteriota bacterium]